MIRWCDNGHPPARVVSGRRCALCVKRRGRNPLRDAMREATRATPAERGYGAQHRAARAALAASLPAVCGYGCGTLLEPGRRWVAAHLIDGDPDAGYLASCLRCNQRAMQRGKRGSLA